jgi:hypothetical protein
MHIEMQHPGDAVVQDAEANLDSLCRGRQGEVNGSKFVFYGFILKKRGEKCWTAFREHINGEHKDSLGEKVIQTS